jgi:hypothetical protein
VPETRNQLGLLSLHELDCRPTFSATESRIPGKMAKAARGISDGQFSGLQKASILMLALGEEQAGKLLATMHEDEVRSISATMAGVPHVRRGQGRENIASSDPQQRRREADSPVQPKAATLVCPSRASITNFFAPAALGIYLGARVIIADLLPRPKDGSNGRKSGRMVEDYLLDSLLGLNVTRSLSANKTLPYSPSASIRIVVPVGSFTSTAGHRRRWREAALTAVSTGQGSNTA